ncbi:diguanylate cyclase [Singulisphaera sp. PoT]|uniref:diguanylate cyclase n=1 Tax=Singulisphaera sp. PoT TaxID=3411797 RepID=UPI003BF478B9
MKILIAEDERVSALRIRRSLEKLGYEVTVVDNGADAWKLIRAGGVELLISDWMMPEIDGLELCRLARAQADALYTYIILLTSRSASEDRVAGLEAGADDFLTKPPDTGELISRLNVARRILTMQEQLRAHSAQLSELQLALARQNALLERQNALLFERASLDGLTGLSNRRHFEAELAKLMSPTGQFDQTFSLIFLDIDNFRSYNERLGHLAGDDALRSLADLLRSQLRADDVVARYAGERFAMILPRTGEAEAREIAERVRLEAARQGGSNPITLSLGVATAALPFPEPPIFVQAADRALAHSKAQGRDRVTHFSEIASALPVTQG